MRRFLLAVCGVLLGAVSCAAAPTPPSTKAINPEEAGAVCRPQSDSALKFPGKLDSALPCDVPDNIPQGYTLEQVQRVFEILGWKSFIAMNWPFQQGQPQPRLSDPGQPRWVTWKEAYDVYLPGGAQPAPWGAPRTIPPTVCKQRPAGATRVLYRNSKAGALQVADEMEQAFTYPLWDQSGNIVRYEVQMNILEFDYLVKNELYNIEGQIAFNKANPQGVKFPSGSNSSQQPGVIEIKMAWKILTPKDVRERYFTTEALVVDESTGDCVPQLLGMVGMHISQKTASSPQWIWSTFEHVDNIDVNSLADHVTRPSFTDPSCATCEQNGQPTVGLDGKKRNQLGRMVPVPKETAALNAQVQALLARDNSVLRYYELISTQWPVNPGCPPANTGAKAALLTLDQFKQQFPGCRAYQVYTSLSEKTAAAFGYTGPRTGSFVVVNDDQWKISNKAGGQPNPVYLTNLTMESYFQKGDQTAQFQIQGFPFDDTPVFGTESCMGCHYSSGSAVGYSLGPDGKTKEAVYGPPLTADFSWLLQLKAQFKQPTLSK